MKEDADPAGRCQRCGRAVGRLTRHRLIPRTRRARRRNERELGRDQVRVRAANVGGYRASSRSSPAAHHHDGPSWSCAASDAPAPGSSAL